MSIYFALPYWFFIKDETINGKSVKQRDYGEKVMKSLQQKAEVKVWKKVNVKLSTFYRLLESYNWFVWENISYGYKMIKGDMGYSNLINSLIIYLISCDCLIFSHVKWVKSLPSELPNRKWYANVGVYHTLLFKTRKQIQVFHDMVPLRSCKPADKSIYALTCCLGFAKASFLYHLLQHLFSISSDSTNTYQQFQCFCSAETKTV